MATGMKRIESLSMRLGTRIIGLARDVKGQDLIEYALMAGFVAVAAAALMPDVSSSISTVFSKITSVMTAAAAS
jgi:pilus assembly protein Flp/PilA